MGEVWEGVLQCLLNLSFRRHRGQGRRVKGFQFDLDFEGVVCLVVYLDAYFLGNLGTAVTCPPLQVSGGGRVYVVDKKDRY